MIEETPVAMRRRLLLERTAWQLSRTQLSVTDIGLHANYGSLEAFTRAFRGVNSARDNHRIKLQIKLLFLSGDYGSIY